MEDQKTAGLTPISPSKDEPEVGSSRKADNQFPEVEEEASRPVKGSNAVETRNKDDGDLIFVSQMFPTARTFLKERLSNSIKQRRSRLSDSKEAAEVAAAECGPTESESVSCQKPLVTEIDTLWSREITRWKRVETFPTPPKVNDLQSHFVCPVCSLPRPIVEASGDLWILHVVRDLKAYVCLAENCKSPRTVFDTFDEWAHHLQAEDKPSNFDDLSCLLCSGSSVGLNRQSQSTVDREIPRQHIATHLQNVALFSLSVVLNKQNLGTGKGTKENVQSQFVRSEISPPQIPDSTAHHNMIPHVSNTLTRPTMSAPAIVINQIPQINGSLRQISTTVSHEQPPKSIARDRLPNSPMARNETPHRIPDNSPFAPCPPTMKLERTSKSNEMFEVLIVDDNLINRKMYTLMLNKYGHQAVDVADGQQAVNAVKKRKYDVILMDIWMPVMGGLDATSHIRAYERQYNISRTPIIMLSASSMSETMEPIYKSECDDYMFKPTPMGVLWARVDWYGRQARTLGLAATAQFLGRVGQERSGSDVTGGKLFVGARL